MKITHKNGLIFNWDIWQPQMNVCSWQMVSNWTNIFEISWAWLTPCSLLCPICSTIPCHLGSCWRKITHLYGMRQLTNPSSSSKHLWPHLSKSLFGPMIVPGPSLYNQKHSAEASAFGSLQEGQPIAFKSKSHTDTGTCCANIERELLMVVFACIRFHTYL